jgi:hypothetical protein
MTTKHETTKNFNFPLSWDKYPNDRDMLREDLVRIDAAIKEIADSAAGSADSISYDNDGTEETVQEALDQLFDRTDTFEIAMNATTGADTSEVLWGFVATKAFVLPINLTGTMVSVLPMGSPLDLTIRVEHNGVFVGNILIDDNLATYDFPADLSVAVGDELVLYSNDSVTFRSLSVTLLAVRVD